ncbi:MAG: GtrA family protein [Burkholderiales bacterium]|nr:GtrA family protein [Burkholderiales bacterium]
MQFVRFIVSGAANTGITYLLYLLLLPLLGYLTAYSAAYVIGVVLSYWLNSVFVFRQPMSWRTLLRFPLVYVVQFTLTGALLWLFVDVLGIDERFALLGAIAVTVPVTFLAARLAILSGSGRRR